MSTPRRRLFVVVMLFTLLGSSAGSIWRVTAQNRAATRTPVRASTDRLQPAPVSSGDRGTTYHAIENRARRVTTRFAEATAVAERGPDGRLSTRLSDLAGNEVARFLVDRVDAENDSLEFTLPDGTARRAARRPGLRPTLDWSAEQAYSLWKDRGAVEQQAFEWQDTLMRPAGARRRDAGAEVVQVDTEWAGGLSATVTKKIGTHISFLTDREATGLVYISSFKKDGVEIGFSQWWPQEQTFAWSFPGLTEGFVDARRLKPHGGWRLAPDMAWMNTQSLAFYEFHTLVQTRGATSSRRSNWFERVGGAIFATLRANEPGCDYLHWLDGSIFRPCCDSHDLCYAKEEPACGASSWWMWWSSWRCNECNIFVVACFATGGSGHVLQRFP